MTAVMAKRNQWIANHGFRDSEVHLICLQRRLWMRMTSSKLLLVAIRISAWHDVTQSFIALVITENIQQLVRIVQRGMMLRESDTWVTSGPLKVKLNQKTLITRQEPKINMDRFSVTQSKGPASEKDWSSVTQWSDRRFRFHIHQKNAALDMNTAKHDTRDKMLVSSTPCRSSGKVTLLVDDEFVAETLTHIQGSRGVLKWPHTKA